LNIQCFQEWLQAALPAGVTLLLGPWTDNESDAGRKFLSMYFDGGSPPGPASRSAIIHLWYASPRNGSTATGGQLAALEDVQVIDKFLSELPADRPFANVVPITGIIGPKTADGGRIVYTMTIEVTT